MMINKKRFYYLVHLFLAFINQQLVSFDHMSGSNLIEVRKAVKRSDKYFILDVNIDLMAAC